MNDLLLRRITDSVLIAHGLQGIELQELFKKEGFLRNAQGGAQNSAHHVCVHTCLYDPNKNTVWLGLHKKSCLWLPPGEHIEEFDSSPSDAARRCLEEELQITSMNDRITNPEIMTETRIFTKGIQCKHHYDLWFFVEVNEEEVTWACEEFESWSWFPFTEVLTPNATDINKSVKKAISYLVSKS